MPESMPWRAKNARMLLSVKGEKMTREDLLDPLMQKQDSLCALRIIEACKERKGDLSLLDRWAVHIMRIVPGAEGGIFELDNCQLVCIECHWQHDDNMPNSKRPDLYAAFKMYRLWVVIEGDLRRRIKSLQGMAANTTKSPYLSARSAISLQNLHHVAEEERSTADKELKSLVHAQPEWEAYLKDAPGAGVVISAFLLSKIDLDLATTVSKVWRFLGYDPTEEYNPGKGKMKSVLYAGLSISLIRMDPPSPYRPMYDMLRDKELSNGKKVSHGGAIKRIIKLWLSHWWETAQKYRGTYPREPWITAQGDEHEFVPATEFGWPEVAEVAEKVLA
jgi:hypothetical protein